MVQAMANSASIVTVRGSERCPGGIGTGGCAGSGG